MTTYSVVNAEGSIYVSLAGISYTGMSLRDAAEHAYTARGSFSEFYLIRSDDDPTVIGTPRGRNKRGSVVIDWNDDDAE